MVDHDLNDLFDAAAGKSKRKREIDGPRMSHYDHHVQLERRLAELEDKVREVRNGR